VLRSSLPWLKSQIQGGTVRASRQLPRSDRHGDFRLCPTACGSRKPKEPQAEPRPRPAHRRGPAGSRGASACIIAPPACRLLPPPYRQKDVPPGAGSFPAMSQKSSNPRRRGPDLSDRGPTLSMWRGPSSPVRAQSYGLHALNHVTLTASPRVLMRSYPVSCHPLNAQTTCHRHRFLCRPESGPRPSPSAGTDDLRVARPVHTTTCRRVLSPPRRQRV